jgi:hypothetical protein
MVKVHMLIKDGSNTLILAFWHWLQALKSIIKFPKCGLFFVFKQINTYFFKSPKGVYDRGLPIPYLSTMKTLILYTP